MKYKYICDLHGHSYYSDGKCSPSEIVDISVLNGLDIIALTDHDVAFGIDEFESKIIEVNKKGKRIIGIPGIEVTTEVGHIILLFETSKEVKEFSKTLSIEKINSLDEVIKNSSKYKKYIIVPHIEVPHIGSFSFDDLSRFFKKFPSEMLHTGLEALNGESLVMPKFMLKKHKLLHQENMKNGWNRKLFGNSDHHSKHGIGVGVTEIESDFEIKTAKDFIENIINGAKGTIKVKKQLTKKELLSEYFYILSGTIRKKIGLRHKRVTP